MLFGLLVFGAIVGVVFGAIVGVVFAFVATYNGLVAAAEKATRAWNDLDALLRQRHDEIPRLVEMCEPYLARDRAVLQQLLEARAAVFAARQTRDADELGQAEAKLRTAAAAMMTRAAAHAELDSNPAFGLLRQRKATLDLELNDRRERYNAAVSAYNSAIGRAPGNLVAVVGEFRPLRQLEIGPIGS